MGNISALADASSHGSVRNRQGFVFLSLEDQVGVTNAIIMPTCFRKTACW